MESYLRIRYNLFLVSFWKRAPFHFACRPSRPGKTIPSRALLVRVLFYWVQLESQCVLESRRWKRRCNSINSQFSTSLLLPDEDIDRSAAEIPLLPDFVLKETLVGILDVLRQVCKEYECGYLRTLQLCAVLYLDVLTLG